MAIQPTPPKVPPSEKRVYQGFLKGNQCLTSPDDEGPRLFLGGCTTPIFSKHRPDGSLCFFFGGGKFDRKSSKKFKRFSSGVSFCADLNKQPLGMSRNNKIFH